MAVLEECTVFCALTLDIHETNQTGVCDKFYIGTLTYTHTQLQEHDSISHRNFLIRVDKDKVNIPFGSDQAHFRISRLVNLSCYWANKKPNRILQKLLHTTKVMARCKISSFMTTSLYFFKGSNKNATTATSAFYFHMIQTFSTPKLTKFPQVNESTSFHQEGTTLYITINSLMPQTIHSLITPQSGTWPLLASDTHLFGGL